MKLHFALLCSLTLLGFSGAAFAQDAPPKKFDQEDKFRQLEEILPTANAYRTSSGAPGHGYWQQRADYVIDVELDDENQRIIAHEQITYHNNSPDELRYLWLQLDQNIFRADSDANLTATAPDLDRVSFGMLKSYLESQSFAGGMNITHVADAEGNPLSHSIVKTMMRVDLPRPLRTGESTVFTVDWNYNINDCNLIRGRSGYEFFEKDGNYLYGIAQWFPRMVAYTDANGWQHKQFLGRGEFTLELGDYEVRLTVPDDHIVGATGILQNPEDVLTETQRQRLRESKTASRPMFIVSPEEAAENEKSKPSGKKTWIYKAENVRDYAFCSSRKFIWDAQGHNVNGNEVLAMSFYPNEGEPLWSQYSTHSIIHTLNVYSRYTFDYPYPIAISVNGPISGGMEYPMICFNGPRPEEDGTYTARTKYGLISVVIHEVGHNYFPMIVNSDERQWTWMDEGLNSFLQFLAEQEWEEDYPSRRGEPQDIVEYMASTNQVPIMTNSESLLQFGPNGYSKPATALNVLRETVLGRELFDFAFKEYAIRWKFKRPMPADFFRTMEDASGIDLDWFWRGWFYSTDHCDLGITNVRVATMKSGNPYTDKAQDRADRDAEVQTLSQQRNKDLPKRIDEFPELRDFYNEFDELNVTDADREQYEKFLAKLDDDEKEMLNSQANFYVVDLQNVGGLVMPVILKIEFEDGTEEELRIPAEIWRYDNEKVSKLILTPKIISQITLDPHLETADVDLENNFFPPKIIKSRFELFKEQQQSNPIRDAQKAGDAATADDAAATGGQ